MSGEPATPVLPQRLPEDWVQPRDLPCPACRYNLKMLRAPRCPECGLVFRWQQLLQVHCPRCDEPLYACDADACPVCRLPLNWRALLDSARVYDSRLYEYAPHPIRAAVRTWLAAARPNRFWKRIPLEMPPMAMRLRRLRGAAVGVSLIGMIMLLIPANMRWSLWRPFGLGDPFCLLAPLYVLPLATGFALPRFTPTLARCRVRGEQLLRCLAYGTSGLAWLGVLYGVLAVAGLAITFGRGPGPGRWPVAFHPYLAIESLLGTNAWRPLWFGYGFFWLNAAVVLAWLWFGLIWWWAFLYVGLRRFLRLDRGNAWALLLSTQAIGLVALAVALQFTGLGQYATARVMQILGYPF